MPPTDPSAAARLLDGAAGERVLERASAAAGMQLSGLRLRSVHHRAGRSLSHVYEATLHAGTSSAEVLLVTHLDERQLPPGTFTIDVDGRQVAVWRFPNDPFLPGLPSAVHRGRVRELLDRLGGEPGEVRLHTRAYRPSRRAVVEVRIAGAQHTGRILYLKVLSGDRAQELADVHRRLSAVVPVPKVIGVAPAQGILALAAVPGRTLRQALISGDPLPDPDALVGLTRSIAASRLHTRRSPRIFADPRRHVDLLQRLVPEEAETIERVASAAAELDGPLVPVHGDLHDGQLLLVDGRVTGVLDVDGAGDGLVAEDVGNLVAHLEVLAMLHPEASARTQRYAAAVADAFRREVGVEALARATAGQWLALATGPYRAQDEDWRAATRARIVRAAAALDAG